MSYTIELSNINDIDAIIKLYSDRMKWFKEKNIKQWSRYLNHHPKEEFIETIRNKDLYVVKEDTTIVACFELSTDSRYWNDNLTPAYYIYKLVTKVGYKDLGNIIFQKCLEYAKQDNKECIRIDCLKSNKKLNDIYEKHNFKLIKYGCIGSYYFSLRELKVN